MTTSSSLTRRHFLKRMLAASGTLALPSSALAHTLDAATVRVRGRVQSGGEGLSDVGVTDGRSVVTTGTDGTFELLADGRQPFVYLSIPAGYRIPVSNSGTARFYEPLRSEAEQTVTFDLEPLPASDEHHHLLVWADPQTRDQAEMRMLHEQTVPDVQDLAQSLSSDVQFGVSCGDIMFDDLSLLPEYERAVSRTGIPFFQVVGNHDLNYDALTDGASDRTFRTYFGPTYYSFDRGAVHYVVLDDVFWNHDAYFGYLDDRQLGWLRQDLARVEAGRPVVVLLHIPVLSTRYQRNEEANPHPRRSVTNRAALYRLLEPYAAHIIAGHLHESEHLFEHGVHEHICGAVCGTWWNGPICHGGAPKGYGLYEARGEEVRWQYKSTGYPLDHQIRVYDGDAPSVRQDEIVANVWDWDPEWTVLYYENGARRGAMERRTGIDPLARQTRERPKPTRHLFYASRSADARHILIEATDRWGRTYTATPRQA